jgi:hypothetical protein
MKIDCHLFIAFDRNQNLLNPKRMKCIAMQSKHRNVSIQIEMQNSLFPLKTFLVLK